MRMRDEKRHRLEAKGGKVGTAKEFLELSDEEETYIDLKLRLAQSLRQRRRQRRLAQVALARASKSSQSRVAKMEAGDPSVSIDLLVRSLLVLDTSAREISRILASIFATRDWLDL